MRKIDESKKGRITEAVYRIVKEDGAPALSLGRIAKMANVSPGTPYVYYKDKTDMLSKIFLEAKALLDEGIEADISDAPTTEEKVFRCVYHYVASFHENPEASAYCRAMCNNAALLDRETARGASAMAEPVYAVYRQALEEGLVKEPDLDVIIPMLYGPVLMAIDRKNDAGQDWAPEEMEPLIRLSMAALLG